MACHVSHLRKVNTCIAAGHGFGTGGVGRDTGSAGYSKIKNMGSRLAEGGRGFALSTLAN